MYTPKLNELLVRELYQLKLRVKKPMTRLVDEAVREYLEKQKSEIKNESRN